MPAIITHHIFGQDVYGELFESIGGSRDEAEAFLLGNQGPDPLFYAVLDPRLFPASRLGTIMHRTKPNELFVALKEAVSLLPPEDASVGRAYVLGFLSHYVLDSLMHPFIFAQEYELLDAGEPGLDRENHHDVHSLIETELDEMVLTVKRGERIATFNPATIALKGSFRMLSIVSQLYAYAALRVYGISIPADTFKLSVYSFRRIQMFFYSPSGLKHNIIGRVEMLIRPYSFYRAMSHQNVDRPHSIFDNREKRLWIDPFTDAPSHDDFWTIYQRALKRAQKLIDVLDDANFDIQAARTITNDLNFNGEPVVAMIISVQDGKNTSAAKSTPNTPQSKATSQVSPHQATDKNQTKTDNPSTARSPKNTPEQPSDASTDTNV